MVKLIAIDLDGTLLNSKKQVDRQTIDLLARYARQGCRFAFCTGRTLNEMREITAELPFFSYAVLCNGAYVAELPGGRVLREALLTAEDVSKVHRLLRDFDMLFDICYQDQVFTERVWLERIPEFGLAGLEPMVRMTRTPVERFDHAFRIQGELVGKVNIFFRSSADRNRAKQIMEELPYAICYQESNNLEVNRRGVDKGAGLRWLAEHLGLQAAEVAAIGDNRNDLPMLRYAGIAVAMENAIAPVKAVADFVTRSNDEQGVACAVVHLLENAWEKSRPAAL